MNQPDAQNVYDHTVRFLSRQGCRSVRGVQSAPAYFGIGGRNCSVGMYIPQPLYVKWDMEGRGIADLIHVDKGVDRFPGLMRVRPWFRTHENLLRSLMQAHDASQGAVKDSRFSLLAFVSADPIVNRLRAVAQEHGLDDSVLDQLTWPELWL